MQHHIPTSLTKILLFLQPLKFLTNNTQLPFLQQHPLPFFDDRLITQLSHGNSLRQKLLNTYKPIIIYYIIIVQITVTIKIMVSYILQLMLANLNIMKYPALLSICFIFQVTFEQHYFQNIYQVSQKIRLSLTQILYAKLQSTTLSRIQEVSKGQYFNIISMDLNDIDLTWLLAFTGAPIILSIGLYLLISYFGWCAIIGLLTLCSIMYLQRKITQMTGSLKQEKNTIQDERTKLTEEVLYNLRILKIHSWEFIYRNIILRQRDKQDDKTKQILSIDALANSLNGNINVFISLLVMLIAYKHTGNQLTSDTIFSAIWILQLIKVWCITYGQRAYKAIINLRILEQRLNEIFDVQDIHTVATTQISQQSKKKKKYLAFKEEDDQQQQVQINIDPQTIESEDISITFLNYTAYWTKLQESQNQPIINKLNLKLDSSFILIQGKVGSGKSSIFQAILNEIPYTSGSISVCGHIAYVEQSPYIFPGTLIDNILFGCPFNNEHYKNVLEQSALVKDNIADDFQVGENGCNLSGGQRARLSLCRALYSDADIYLLDDVLSAVDTQVANHLVKTLQDLKEKGKLVILISHKKVAADLIFNMENGELLQKDITFEEDIGSIQVEEPLIDKQVNQEQVDDQIDQSIYRQYVKEGGVMQFGIIVILYLLDAIFSLFIINRFGHEEIPYISICIYGLINYLKFRQIFHFTINAINSMHRKLLTAIIMVQVKLLQNIGQLMSRFTTDLNNIEIMAMMDFHWVVEGAIDNLFVIIIVSLSKEIIIISMLFLFAMFYIKSIFQPAMKLSLQQDDLTRASLYSKLQSSITGLTLIRAYNQQQRFMNEFLDLTYTNMQASFTFLRLNALLGYIIEMSLHILIIMVMFILIASGVDKNILGFSLLMLMQLGYMFSLNLRGQIYLDIDMQNVKRVLTSIQLPSEDYDENGYLPFWAKYGEIEFKKVNLFYGNKQALKDVSFHIKQGETVGIMGRTGSGKSSIVNALLRLFPISEGSILIDEFNFNQATLSQLRKSILVIPQQCPIFSQSIRFNMDPSGQFDNSQLMFALQQVGLKSLVEKLPNGLNETNYNLSAGQKQLLAMSRVFLDLSKRILIFDESTSNIDSETEEMIEKALQNISVTKIIIAHREHILSKCDKIIRMQDGEILSIDEKQKN